MPKLRHHKASSQARLLDAARRRPIAEVGRASIPLPAEERCGRSSWTFEPVTPENLDRCYRDGLGRLSDQPEGKANLASSRSAPGRSAAITAAAGLVVLLGYGAMNRLGSTEGNTPRVG